MEKVKQRMLKLPPEERDLVHKAYRIAIMDKFEVIGADLETRTRLTGEIQEDAKTLLKLFKERK